MDDLAGRQSHAKRLRIAILTATGCLLLLSAMVNIGYTSWATYEDIQHFAGSTARGTALATAPALQSGDVQGTTAFLQSLSAEPRFLAAAVYDNHGTLFAKYGEVSTLQFDTWQQLTVSAPIIQDGVQQGSILLSMNLTRLWTNLGSHAVASAVLVLLALMVALPISRRLGDQFVRPVRRLNEAMNAVTREGNLDLRVEIEHDDELGALVSQFNDMLEQLQQGDRRLRVAQRMARLGYWELDTKTGEFALSEQLAAICDAGNEEPVEAFAQFRDIIEASDRERFESDVARVIDTGRPLDADYRLQPQGGALVHAHQQLDIERRDGLADRLIATVQDVTQQRNAEAQIRKLAYFDSLTGLASRSYLYQRIEEMIDSAHKEGKAFALFFMDLDTFKDVNDSLGHQAGDQLLKVVAGRLVAALREPDFVARLGGDEFCMLLADVSDEVDIERIAQRCMGSIEAPVDLGARTIRPQISIGIARYPQDGDDVHELVQAADSAMYEAKDCGKHQCQFFRKAMTRVASQRLELAQELREALRKGEFELFYQPQISLASGAIIAYEALARWNHPNRGMVPPNDFIPELERLGLINELGDWAIRVACEQMVSWQDAGMDTTRVCVNLSPSHLQSMELIDVVSSALQDTGIAPQQLELEVTETGIQYSEETYKVLLALKELGVDIAIDDFGTGYSSLGSLQQLPIDCLKIDRVFVKDILTNPKDSVLLGTIMTLAHALGFRVVAEGVEELAQIHILSALGCDIAQGFYFSRPVPADEVGELHTASFIPNMDNVAHLVPNQ